MHPSSSISLVLSSCNPRLGDHNEIKSQDRPTTVLSCLCFGGSQTKRTQVWVDKSSSAPWRHAAIPHSGHVSQQGLLALSLSTKDFKVSHASMDSFSKHARE